MKSMIEYNATLEYMKEYTFQTINDRLVKKLHKIADELAREIVNSYDFEQIISNRIDGEGGKIIITSVLTKKKEKK